MLMAILAAMSRIIQIFKDDSDVWDFKFNAELDAITLL